MPPRAPREGCLSGSTVAGSSKPQHVFRMVEGSAGRFLLFVRSTQGEHVGREREPLFGFTKATTDVEIGAKSNPASGVASRQLGDETRSLIRRLVRIHIGWSEIKFAARKWPCPCSYQSEIVLPGWRPGRWPEWPSWSPIWPDGKVRVFDKGKRRCNYCLDLLDGLGTAAKLSSFPSDCIAKTYLPRTSYREALERQSSDQACRENEISLPWVTPMHIVEGPLSWIRYQLFPEQEWSVGYPSSCQRLGIYDSLRVQRLNSQSPGLAARFEAIRDPLFPCQLPKSPHLRIWRLSGPRAPDSEANTMR